MRVTMVMVSSLNGMITRDTHEDIYSWSSKEDTSLFFSQIAKNNLIVMGSKTYEASRDKMVLRPDKLRVVLTSKPDRYRKVSVPGSLEFRSESPKELIKKLERRGYRRMLLVGGGEVNASFFRESLVDEVHVTIEPLLFGKGKNLVSQELGGVSLRFISCKKLNSAGSLHLRYKVNK